MSACSIPQSLLGFGVHYGGGDDLPTFGLLQPNAHELERVAAARSLVEARAGHDGRWPMLENFEIAHFHLRELGATRGAVRGHDFRFGELTIQDRVACQHAVEEIRVRAELGPPKSFFHGQNLFASAHATKVYWGSARA